MPCPNYTNYTGCAHTLRLPRAVSSEFVFSGDIKPLWFTERDCYNHDQMLITAGANCLPDCRPRHYWTDANLRMELEPHVIALQHNPLATPTRYLPTRKALCQAGLTALATALATRGGVYSVTVMNLMNAKVIPR